MTDPLEYALTYTFGNEGGYTNDPDDAGGPTKFGITQKTLEDYLGYPASADVIKNLDISTAKNIYEKKYWGPLGCAQITDLGVATCIFDTSVLYGVVPASRMAERAAINCGAQLKLSGILGDKVIALINAVKPEDFITAYRMLVLDRIDWIIHANPRDQKFRAGWSNRADRLLTLKSLKLNLT